MTRHQPLTAPDATAFSDNLEGELPAGVVASLLASIGDVAFELDDHGVIVNVAVSDRDLARQGFADWVGRAWADVATPDSKAKAVEMLSEASKVGAARWRQINHPTPGGETPVRYLVVRIGDRGRRIAIGRDMRAAAAIQQRLLQTQQSLERDYLRLRQAETRYRLLFDLAADPVLIVDAATRRIREANPAATRLLGLSEAAVDRPVSGIVAVEDREALVAHLGAAGAIDDLSPVTVRLARGGETAHVTATLFRQGPAASLLLRVVTAHPVAGETPYRRALSEIVEHMPDAFVLTDGDFNILTANAAFLEMAEAPALDRVTGMALRDWLGRPGIDLELMAGQLREHGVVRNVATILRGSAGAREEIEVSGVAAPDASGTLYGFTIRNVGRRLRGRVAAGRDAPRSVDQLTELVGRISLKDIVRESTDLIERLCIEAALTYTSDNRASAAEILGVSRQSLYSKLHRHGLGNLVSGDN